MNVSKPAPLDLSTAVDLPARWTRLDKYLAFGIAFVAAAILAFGLAVDGIGMSPDSHSYMEAALNIASGKGVLTGAGDAARPMVRWPPGYPILLLPGAITPVGVNLWAAVLSVILLGALEAGVFLLLRKLGVRTSASLLAAGLLFTAHGLLLNFGMMLSEAPFLVLELALIAALTRDNDSAPFRWLALAGVFAALATLTRFAGQGLILGLCGYVLLAGTHSLRSRVGRALCFFAFAQVPVGLWLLRNWLLTGGVSDLGYASRPFEPEPFKVIWRVLMTYWFPEELPRLLRHGANLVLFGIMAFSIWRRRSQLSPMMRKTCVMCLAAAFGYCVFLLYTVFTSAAQPYTDFRMLLPVVLPLVILMAIAEHAVSGRWRAVLLGLCVTILLIGVVRMSMSVVNMRTHGAHSAWYEH